MPSWAKRINILTKFKTTLFVSLSLTLVSCSFLVDFVIFMGSISLILYYGTLITGTFYFSMFTHILIAMAFLPFLPSLPYLFAGKTDEIGSHFLATGLFTLAPILLGVIIGMIGGPSHSIGNIILPVSAIMYIGTFIWGIIDAFFLKKKSIRRRRVFNAALPKSKNSCKQTEEPLSGKQFLNCQVLAFQYQY